MLETHIDLIKEYIKKNENFVIATVVRRDAPSSGKVGDKAIIDKRGKLYGWVGGGCVKGILMKEAEEALRKSESKLVRIGKTLEKTNQNGVAEYKMTCQSEGNIEIFLEPIASKPHLVIVGKTEIAKSLSKLASSIGYKITGVSKDSDLKTYPKVDELITDLDLTSVKTNSQTKIIICTQGDGDESILDQVLRKEASFIGFVSSKKKMQSLKYYLNQLGHSDESIKRIHAPVGIDISAKQPDEVAISILAEIIQDKYLSEEKTTFKSFENKSALIEKNTSSYYINPVCGVPVDPQNPKHTIEYKGEKVYFCCDGCKDKFVLEPEKYMNVTM
jgi:xanthine dehydrogenase accessory factor